VTHLVSGDRTFSAYIAHASHGYPALNLISMKLETYLKYAKV
jgi:hypothetical protein